MDLIWAFDDGCIGADDIILMFLIDGAQLYAMKASACWIYIWVLLNLPPVLRYKKDHVFISGFIPGPNNPKNLDSFLFPGLQHLVALQREGLQIWDAVLQREMTSKVFLALITANGPGMMHVTGLVGYHGKHGCRLYCRMKGHREEHGKHYFPALLKPEDYNV
jgi:Transposase family tnp2